MSSSIRQWLRFPSRIALLLGLGALSAAGAKAEPGIGLPRGDDARVPQQSAKAFGDLLIWSEAGRIYVSEAGKPAEELRLGDSAEADRLRQLLVREAATAAAPQRLHDRIILVGAGGSGFNWEAQRTDDAGRTRAVAARDRDRDHSATRTAKAGPTPPPERADGTSK